MEPHPSTSGTLVRPRPVTSRYGGPGDTPAKRRAARQERRLRAYRIARAVPHIPHGSRVLDVGCGDGELFRWLGSRLGLGIGIDPMLPGSIVGARYRLSRGWFPEDLPDMGSFDVVTMLAVLEEVPVEGRAWLAAACIRRLAPGGRLIFTAPPEVADQLRMGWRPGSKWGRRTCSSASWVAPPPRAHRPSGRTGCAELHRPDPAPSSGGPERRGPSRQAELAVIVREGRECRSWSRFPSRVSISQKIRSRAVPACSCSTRRRR